MMFGGVQVVLFTTMNKKEFSTHRGNKIIPAKDQGLPDPLPEFVGVKGGDKQTIHNQNLDYIYDTYHKYGDRYTMALFHMAPNTLKRVIKRAEKNRTKDITKADLAYRLGQRHEEKIYEHENSINNLVNFLNDYVELNEEKWEEYYEFLQLLGILATRYSKRQRITPKNSTTLHKNDRANFKAKLARLHSKVDKSCIEVDYTVIDKKGIPASAGGSFHRKRLEQAPGNHRDSFLSNKEPGSSPLLPGPQTPRLSPRQRYQNAKARIYRRV